MEKTFYLVCKNQRIYQRMNIVHDDVELFFNGIFNLIFLLTKGLFCIDMAPTLLKEGPQSVVGFFWFFFSQQTREILLLASVTCKGFTVGSDNLPKEQIKIIWNAKHVIKSVIKDCCFNHERDAD